MGWTTCREYGLRPPTSRCRGAAYTPAMREGCSVRVVVVSWNGAHLLRPCLDSLRAQTARDRFEIVVVDNASEDDTAALLATEYPEVARFANHRNLGFAGGVAAATARYDGDAIVLLNNDATFAPDAVEHLLAALESDAAVGAVTAKVLLTQPDDQGRAVINSTGNVVSRDGRGFDRDWLRPDGAVDAEPDVFGFCGAAAALRTSALRQVGGFDGSLFLYYEDTDVSWRLRAAGWDVRYEPRAVAWHRHAASSDVASPLFRYYNTRNSLVVFTRHAPLRTVFRSVARQVLGAVRAASRDGWRAPTTRARVRGLGSWARRLPLTLIERRRQWSGSSVPRRVVARYLVAGT